MAVPRRPPPVWAQPAACHPGSRTRGHRPDRDQEHGARPAPAPPRVPRLGDAGGHHPERLGACSHLVGQAPAPHDLADHAAAVAPPQLVDQLAPRAGELLERPADPWIAPGLREHRLRCPYQPNAPRAPDADIPLTLLRTAASFRSTRSRTLPSPSVTSAAPAPHGSCSLSGGRGLTPAPAGSPAAVRCDAGDAPVAGTPALDALLAQASRGIGPDGEKPRRGTIGAERAGARPGHPRPGRSPRGLRGTRRGRAAPRFCRRRATRTSGPPPVRSSAAAGKRGASQWGGRRSSDGEGESEDREPGAAAAVPPAPPQRRRPAGGGDARVPIDPLRARRRRASRGGGASGSWPRRSPGRGPNRRRRPRR